MYGRNGVCWTIPVSSVLDWVSCGIRGESRQSPILDIDILYDSSFHSLVGEPRVDFGEVSNHDRFEPYPVVRDGCITFSLFYDPFVGVPLAGCHGCLGSSFGKTRCGRVLGEMTKLSANSNAQSGVIFRELVFDDLYSQVKVQSLSPQSAAL